jgi:hypothetical protein
MSDERRRGQSVIVATTVVEDWEEESAVCQVARARLRERGAGAAQESGADARRDRHLG